MFNVRNMKIVAFICAYMMCISGCALLAAGYYSAIAGIAWGGFMVNQLVKVE